MIPMFERAKTVHVLDFAANVIFKIRVYCTYKLSLTLYTSTLKREVVYTFE
jgi:hypothetical protein